MTSEKQIKIELANDYGEKYLKFQNWDLNNFSIITKTDSRYFAKEIKKSKRVFSAGANVLEIGFGNGVFLQYANNKGWNVTGTELNTHLVDEGIKKGFNVFYKEKLDDFSNDYFDLVVAFDVLEHIPQENILAFLKQVKRVLKPEGIFLARFPNADSPFGLCVQHSDVTHVNAIGSGKVRYFTNLLNLELVYCGGEAEIIWTNNILISIHKSVTFIVRRLIDIFVYLVFFRRKNFSSSNLLMIARKI